ncbi:ROK family protein [Lentibacillus saliphilus]|uniref:ROK family protein n=1 Tax=Lentibacillus saliphilus TaxID=2737028 RepID=UPI001C2F79E0|nr:ROK family protein [Lentibacillus saliphilus]
MGHILALDMGGTHMKYGLVTRDGQLLKKGKVPTPKRLDELMLSIKRCLDTFSTEVIDGIAVSSPGAVASDGVIYGSSSIPYIHGPNMKTVLETATGLPVHIENDANCAALAEVWQGTAAGKKDVAVVVIGTGIGGALIQNGTIHKGANLHGGEFGYMILDPIHLGQGQGMNTFSELASTSSIIRRVARYKQVDASTLTGERVFELAQSGDADCIKAINEFYNMLALGIYNIQYAYDPELILLGGAISTRPDMIERVMKEVGSIVSAIDVAQIIPHVDRCHFLADANLIGAVYHFLQQIDETL